MDIKSLKAFETFSVKLGLPFGKGWKVGADLFWILRVSDLRHLLSNYQQAMQDEQEQHHWQFKVRPATEPTGP